MADDVDRNRHYFLSVATAIIAGADISLVSIQDTRSRNMDANTHVMNCHIHA
jgi:hypothetical protein